MKILIEPISKEKGNEILGLWEEYEAATTEEGKLAKALDKIEALIQHNECDPSTLEEGEAEFNLEYLRKYTGAFEFMKKLRALVDEKTKQTIEKRKK